MQLTAASAAGDDMLLLAERGRGPLKAHDGASSEKMVFTTNDICAVNDALLVMPERESSPSMAASSVNFQATTRGGCAIDGIQKRQGEFQGNHQYDW